MKLEQFTVSSIEQYHILRDHNQNVLLVFFFLIWAILSSVPGFINKKALRTEKKVKNIGLKGVFSFKPIFSIMSPILVRSVILNFWYLIYWKQGRHCPIALLHYNEIRFGCFSWRLVLVNSEKVCLESKRKIQLRAIVISKKDIKFPICQAIDMNISKALYVKTIYDVHVNWTYSKCKKEASDRHI